MAGLRMTRELLRVARTAGFAACILARGEAGQQQEQGYYNYQINLPLN